MSNQVAHDEAEMTFGEHLDELRKILIRVVMVFGVLVVALFAMKGIVLDVVFAPIRETFPTNRLFAWMADVMNSEALRISPDNVELFNNKMAGQFMLHIKSSVVGAFILAFPYLIWELWCFVKPALPPEQRRKSIRYAIECPIWFVMGLLFGYYVIAPLAINFLGNYQVSDQISNIIDVSSFMTTVLSVSCHYWPYHLTGYASVSQDCSCGVACLCGDYHSTRCGESGAYLHSLLCSL